MKKLLLGLGVSVLLLSFAISYGVGVMQTHYEVAANYELLKAKNERLEQDVQSSERNISELQIENNELREKLEQNDAVEEGVLAVENAKEKLEEAKAYQEEVKEKSKNRILDVLKDRYEYDQKLAKTLSTMSPAEQEAYLHEEYEKQVAKVEADFADKTNL